MIRKFNQAFKGIFKFKSGSSEALQKAVDNHISNLMNRNGYKGDSTVEVFNNIKRFLKENSIIEKDDEGFEVGIGFLRKHKDDIFALIHPDLYKEETFFGIECLKSENRRKDAKKILAYIVLQVIIESRGNYNFVFTSKMKKVEVNWKNYLNSDDFKCLYSMQNRIELKEKYISSYGRPYLRELKFIQDVKDNFKEVINQTSHIDLFSGDEKYNKFINVIFDALKESN